VYFLADQRPRGRRRRCRREVLEEQEQERRSYLERIPVKLQGIRRVGSS
jgi:hypothetical protein